MTKRLRNTAIWSIAVLIALCGAFLLATSYGVQVHAVKSGSMVGTLPKGAIVITHPEKNLKRRDVILFHNPGDRTGLTTHTFLGYNKDGSLITKGDANPSVDNFDQPPHQSDVVGKVWRHVDVFAPSFWLTLRGIIVVVCLAFLLLGWWLYQSADETEKASNSTEVDAI